MMELIGLQLLLYKITVLMDGSYTYSLVGFDVNGVVSIRFRAESGCNDFYNDILVDNLAIREADVQVR